MGPKYLFLPIFTYIYHIFLPILNIFIHISTYFHVYFYLFLHIYHIFLPILNIFIHIYCGIWWENKIKHSYLLDFLKYLFQNFISDTKYDLFIYLISLLHIQFKQFSIFWTETFF